VRHGRRLRKRHVSRGSSSQDVPANAQAQRRLLDSAASDEQHFRLRTARSRAINSAEARTRRSGAKIRISRRGSTGVTNTHDRPGSRLDVESHRAPRERLDGVRYSRDPAQRALPRCRALEH
jgi:hypothetical protein